MPIAASAQQVAGQKVILQMSDADPEKWNLAPDNVAPIASESAMHNTKAT